MDRLLLVAFLCVNWASFSFSAGDPWSYDDPSKWQGVCQSGEKQSPIDIKGATHDKGLGTFALKNYDRKPNFNFTAYNNGHGLKVEFSELHYEVSGGGLSDTYTTVQLHIHWGSNNSVGSEHTVYGKQYAAELHFVSYNTRYPNITTALGHPDGLAVLGVLIEVGGSNNPAFSFLDVCGDVTSSGTNKTIPPFEFTPILPTDDAKFFRYNGSLTTPTCNEAVTWTVFKDAVKISQNQMNLLRSLKFPDGNPMVDNFRPVQKLHTRNILSSFEVREPTTATETTSGTKEPTGSASTVKMTAGLLIFMSLAGFFFCFRHYVKRS